MLFVNTESDVLMGARGRLTNDPLTTMVGVQFLASIGLRHLQLSKISTHHCATPLVRPPWKNLAMQYSAQTEPEDAAGIPLSKKKCVPCNSKDLRPMNEESARLLSQKVRGWDLINDDGHLKLKRSWKAKNFVKGLEFFKVIGDIAEAEGHHPNLHLVNWNDVNVEIWTHAIGGLSENDFILAAKISELDVQGLLRKRVTGASSSTS